MKIRKKIFYTIITIIVVLIMLAALYALRIRGSKILRAEEDIIPQEEVIFYRQDNPAWAEETLGTSPYTLKSSGCLVSCIASAAAMMGEEGETPQSLNEQLSERNVYDSEGNLIWGNLSNLEKFGVDVYSDISADILESSLKAGRFPIVRVRMHGIGNLHYVLIVKAESGMFYCMDPLADGLRPLSDYGNRVYAIRCVYELNVQ